MVLEVGHGVVFKKCSEEIEKGRSARQEKRGAALPVLQVD
jgi:hypothetical protein